MRIALNLTSLKPGRTGGMETYVRGLITGYSRLPSKHEIQIMAPAEAKDITSACDDRFTECVTDSWLPALLRKQKRIQVPWQSIACIRAARRFRADIHHCPLNIAIPPWHALANTVLTVHDIEVFSVPKLRDDPEFHYARLFCRRGVKFARKIITVSHFSKKDIVEFFQLDPELVAVVHNGIDETVFRSEPIAVPPGKPLPEPPYLFFPAATWPHKNHIRLLQALALLRDRKRLAVRLVLSGFSQSAHALVRESIQKLGLEAQVEWLGWVVMEDIVRVYQRATALVFPSLHEGFGLPIIEAMACGCPVLCSRTTACGEVAGDAALTFDPAETEEIAAAIESICSNANLRIDLSRKGFVRAREFTCARMAQETLDVFASLV